MVDFGSIGVHIVEFPHIHPFPARTDGSQGDIRIDSAAQGYKPGQRRPYSTSLNSLIIILECKTARPQGTRFKIGKAPEGVKMIYRNHKGLHSKTSAVFHVKTHFFLPFCQVNIDFS